MLDGLRLPFTFGTSGDPPEWVQVLSEAGLGRPAWCASTRTLTKKSRLKKMNIHFKKPIISHADPPYRQLYLTSHNRNQLYWYWLLLLIIISPCYHTYIKKHGLFVCESEEQLEKSWLRSSPTEMLSRQMLLHHPSPHPALIGTQSFPKWLYKYSFSEPLFCRKVFCNSIHK